MTDMTFDSLTTRAAIRELQAIRAAEDAVAPVVGRVMGMDSEFGVWREALKRMGVETKGLHGSAEAARQIFAIRSKAPKPRNLAMDTKASAARGEMFPNGTRLSRTGW